MSVCLKWCSTSFTPCRKGSELEATMLAEGGVGGTRSRIPTVARKQATMAGIAYIKSYKSDRETTGLLGMYIIQEIQLFCQQVLTSMKRVLV